MSGGGSDFPPPELPNGGEFLLSLLQGSHQRPPHNSSRPPPQQALTLDPAVAAVGPTLQFPLHHVPNGLDPSPPRPQNLSPPFPHAFPHNYVGFADDFRRLGVGHPGSGSRGMTQQRDNNVRFGSFSLEIEPFERLPDGNTVESSSLDNFRDVGSASRTHDRLERNRQFNGRGDSSSSSNTFGPGYFHSRDQEKGGGGWAKHNQGANVPRSAPPGFAARPRDGGNVGFREIRRGFEHNAGERSGNFHDLSHRNSSSVDESLRTRGLGFNDHRVHSRVPGETELAGQLDRPGPPQGSDLHSILGSQIGESLANLHFGNVEEENRKEIGGQHRIKRYGGGVDATEFDDLHEQIVDALLEDESEEKRKKLQPASREKEYRSDSRGQRILSQSKRISKRLMHCRSDIHRLNAPFLQIYESLIPPEEEKAKQRQLLSLLEKLVNKEWPDARLYLYGSCANSFGVCKSDIDVCLALQDAELDKSEVLLKLADILQSDNLQNVQALTRARVPIVKLMDPVTGISCDICMNNVLAVVNTKLLRDYAQIDERLRQLAYILKHWAKSRGVNETYQGTLSSYAYVLMCIHFLQQRRPAILPCLQEMEATYSVTVDDKYCAFFDQVEKLRDFGSRNKETIAQLVWAFFSYWAYRHDYTNDVISVRTGCLLSKQEKDWTRRVGNDRHLICIEDPFDISHDLGRVVDKFSIRVLREEFERAAEIMQYDPNPWAKLFEPYISS